MHLTIDRSALICQGRENFPAQMEIDQCSGKIHFANSVKEHTLNNLSNVACAFNPACIYVMNTLCSNHLGRVASLISQYFQNYEKPSRLAPGGQCCCCWWCWWANGEAAHMGSQLSRISPYYYQPIYKSNSINVCCIFLRDL